MKRRRVNETMARPKIPVHKKKRVHVSTARLNRLIEEAIVDAYTESEQITGFCTIIEDNLAMPFVTEVLGVEVVVEKIDLTSDEHIVAMCRRGKIRQRIPILDLPLPYPPPNGAESIEAFRLWRCQT